MSGYLDDPSNIGLQRQHAEAIVNSGQTTANEDIERQLAHVNKINARLIEDDYTEEFQRLLDLHILSHHSLLTRACEYARECLNRYWERTDFSAQELFSLNLEGGVSGKNIRLRNMPIQDNPDVKKEITELLLNFDGYGAEYRNTFKKKLQDLDNTDPDRAEVIRWAIGDLVSAGTIDGGNIIRLPHELKKMRYLDVPNTAIEHLKNQFDEINVPTDGIILGPRLGMSAYSSDDEVKNPAYHICIEFLLETALDTVSKKMQAITQAVRSVPGLYYKAFEEYLENFREMVLVLKDNQ